MQRMSVHTEYRRTAAVAHIVFFNPVLELFRFTALIACFGSVSRDGDGGAGSSDCARGGMTHVSLSPLFNDWDANLTFHSQQPGFFVYNHVFISFSTISLTFICQRLRVLQESLPCSDLFLWWFWPNIRCRHYRWFGSICAQIVYSQAWITTA